MKCEIRKNLFRKIRFHFGTNFFWHYLRWSFWKWKWWKWKLS
jgi:hypothetical protein